MSLYRQAAEQAYQSLLELESRAIDNADRRFYAGYLLGHLSLLGNDNDNDHDSNAQALALHVEAALGEAFGVDRLSDQDKEGIRSLWQEISADIGLAL